MNNIINLTPEQSHIREEKGEYIHLQIMEEQPPNGFTYDDFDIVNDDYGFSNGKPSGFYYAKCPYKINDKVSIRQHWEPIQVSENVFDRTMLCIYPPEDMLEKLWEQDTIISIEPRRARDIDWKDRNNNKVPLYKMSVKGFKQMQSDQKKFVKDFNNKFDKESYESNSWVWVIGLKRMTEIS